MHSVFFYIIQSVFLSLKHSVLKQHWGVLPWFMGKRKCGIPLKIGNRHAASSFVPSGLPRGLLWAALQVTTWEAEVAQGRSSSVLLRLWRILQSLYCCCHLPFVGCVSRNPPHQFQLLPTASAPHWNLDPLSVSSSCWEGASATISGKFLSEPWQHWLIFDKTMFFHGFVVSLFCIGCCLGEEGVLEPQRLSCSAVCLCSLCWPHGPECGPSLPSCLCLLGPTGCYVGHHPGSSEGASMPPSFCVSWGTMHLSTTVSSSFSCYLGCCYFFFSKLVFFFTYIFLHLSLLIDERGVVKAKKEVNNFWVSTLYNCFKLRQSAIYLMLFYNSTMIRVLCISRFLPYENKMHMLQEQA